MKIIDLIQPTKISAKEKLEDKIFLPSEKECYKYEEKIPYLYSFGTLKEYNNIYSKKLYQPDLFIWTRNKSILDNVKIYGGYRGASFYMCVRELASVRPLIKINLEKDKHTKINENIFIFCGTTWIKIDENLYIAETPIAYRRFDEKTNIYEESEIRKFLLSWYEQRKEW